MLFFGGLIALILELSWLENTFRGTYLPAADATFGFLLILVLRAPLLRLSASLEREAWAANWLAAVGLVAGAVAFASFVNREFPRGHLTDREYLVSETEYKKPTTRTGPKWQAQ